MLQLENHNLFKIEMTPQQIGIPSTTYTTANRVIHSFLVDNDVNLDTKTVTSFGEEWKNFHTFSEKEIEEHGHYFFDIITERMVNANTVMADFGCGSGRFIKYFQKRAKFIVGIDPSEAIFAADTLVGKDENVELCQASISNIPYADETFDFAMSIGVLHHIPNTMEAMRDCVKKVKKNGYFCTYIYYNFDNKGFLFKALHKLSEVLRAVVSRMPQKLKMLACDLIAVILYMPFILFATLLKKIKVSQRIVNKIPLSPYIGRTFFIIRNDALDRFGTPLEQRFSKQQIEKMMSDCGLTDIVFSPEPAYWHAVGRKV